MLKVAKHLGGSCGPVRQCGTSSLSGQVLIVFEVDELADGLPVEFLDAPGELGFQRDEVLPLSSVLPGSFPGRDLLSEAETCGNLLWTWEIRQSTAARLMRC